MIRKLNFYEPSQVLQGASTWLARRWRLGDVYDPDPLLGGGTVGGFNELAKIYAYFRVEHVTVKLAVTANEPALPVNFGFLVRVIDPTLSIATLADAQNSLEIGPTTGPMALGTTSGISVVRVRPIKFRLGAVLGDTIAYMADMGFTGLFAGSSPTRNIWGALIVTSPSATNLTNGVVFDLYLTFTVRCFGTLNLME